MFFQASQASVNVNQTTSHLSTFLLCSRADTKVYPVIVSSPYSTRYVGSFEAKKKNEADIGPYETRTHSLSLAVGRLRTKRLIATSAIPLVWGYAYRLLDECSDQLS